VHRAAGQHRHRRRGVSHKVSCKRFQFVQ
jgi:hypothetical protein